MFATIVETWPGLYDVDMEDGTERRGLTWVETQELIARKGLKPFPKGMPDEPPPRNDGADWFLS